MDLPQIMLESDALSAILAINHGNFEGEAGHLVEGILQTKALFSCCSFSYLKRDYNMVAHKLAQFAKSNLCSHVWKGVTPPFVSHLIVSDLEPHAGGSLL
uniref:RNase H type-1 domain-containing protein n=1 Tax=Quercus lobata TaxID=97700 RepID=A0A7N2N1F0_QUELO